MNAIFWHRIQWTVQVLDDFTGFVSGRLSWLNLVLDSACTLKYQSHVRADAFYRSMSKTHKARVNRWGTVFFSLWVYLSVARVLVVLITGLVLHFMGADPA